MNPEVVIGAGAVSGAFVSLWWSVAGDRRFHRRAARNLRAGLATATSTAHHAHASATSAPLAGLVDRVRRLTPAASADKLNRRITMAGMSSRWPLDRTLAMKAILGGTGVVVGVLLLGTGSAVGTFYGLVLPLLGFFGPDLVLRAKGRERQRRIRIAMPDTLDQITVCVEAGLGLEAAMARAARTGSGPLADEVVRTLQDVQLGAARKEALRGLADRNDVAELRQFAQALIQAEAYGVPMGRVLRIQAAELRDKRRKAAEERAMKVSVKMLFPLILCILPVVLLTMLGPAVFNLVDGLGGGLPK